MDILHMIIVLRVLLAQSDGSVWRDSLNRAPDASFDFQGLGSFIDTRRYIGIDSAAI